MKISILLFTLINGIVGGVINQPKYENCDAWNSLIKSTGFDVGSNCCNIKGIQCQDSKVISIDITVNSGEIDLTKLPSSANLEIFSIKGNVYNGVFPIQLLNSQLYNILNLSNSAIKEIPEDFNENYTIEEIYLNNNQIQEFPYQFQKLKNLKLLNLDNNNITGSFTNSCESYVLPESLSLINNNMSGKLYVDKNLRELNVENNHFSSTFICNPGFYHSDYNIDKFYAVNNNFDDSFFEEEQGIIYMSIKELDLSGNKNIKKVKSLPRGIEKLNLSSTGLQQLQDDVFNTDTLRYFDISNNTQFRSPIYQFYKQVSFCNFANTNIKCYEPTTCRNINGNRYEKCYHNKSGSLAYKIYGVFMFLFYIYCCSWCCACSVKRKLFPENDETYTETSDDYSSRQDIDILPDYNDVIKISPSPPLYTENENEASTSFQSDQPEPHLPTYEESMDITNLSHHT